MAAPPPQAYPEDKALRAECLPGCSHTTKCSKNGDLETSQGLPSDSLPSAAGIARGSGTVPPVGPKSWARDAAVVYEPAWLWAGWYLGARWVGGWGEVGQGPGTELLCPFLFGQQLIYTMPFRFHMPVQPVTCPLTLLHLHLQPQRVLQALGSQISQTMPSPFDTGVIWASERGWHRDTRGVCDWMAPFLPDSWGLPPGTGSPRTWQDEPHPWP